MAARKSFLLRISPELWAEIERMAAEEFRSVNAQIEYLLREAVARRRRAIATPDDHRPNADPARDSGAGTQEPGDAD